MRSRARKVHAAGIFSGAAQPINSASFRGASEACEPMTRSLTAFYSYGIYSSPCPLRGVFARRSQGGTDRGTGRRCGQEPGGRPRKTGFGRCGTRGQDSQPCTRAAAGLPPGLIKGPCQELADLQAQVGSGRKRGPTSRRECRGGAPGGVAPYVTGRPRPKGATNWLDASRRSATPRIFRGETREEGPRLGPPKNGRRSVGLRPHIRLKAKTASRALPLRPRGLSATLSVSPRRAREYISWPRPNGSACWSPAWSI